MNNKLYVGNLSHSVSKTELEQMFAPFGTVTSAEVVLDRESGKSKGFAFVEMSAAAEAQAAIAELNGKSVGDRNLVVNEARPREPRAGGGRPAGGRDNHGGGGRKRY